MTKYNADCSMCRVFRCKNNEKDKLPKFCPMQYESIQEEAALLLEKHREFYVKSSAIEKKGYEKWPRAREIIEFAKDMGYKKIGLAFCTGFHNEAVLFSEILQEHGIDYVSAMCKVGGVDKSDSGIPEEYKFKPGEFEAQCNPIAQALVLNKEETDFNVILGLCVGHDSLFMKYSDALCTTLITKDRATGHNPAIALYLKDTYMASRLGLQSKI
ncbi:MAG: DUF1847 domain-containing protein [Saccharofermentanales bacterium]